MFSYNVTRSLTIFKESSKSGFFKGYSKACSKMRGDKLPLLLPK